ncbi:MAG: serine hydrolase [Promethearchaeota archaeon]
MTDSDSDKLKTLVDDLISRCNKSSIILEEIKDWKKALQFKLGKNNQFYITSNGEKLEYNDIYEQEVSCTIRFKPETAFKFFKQDLIFLEAFLSNEFKIKGNFQDFMKLTTLMEYLEDEQDIDTSKSKYEWLVGDPEDYGLKKSLLDEAAKKLKTLDINRNSFLVIRNGVLVYENYFSDKTFQIRKLIHYDVASVTKTLTALVIGVAVKEGYITVNDSIHEWIPDAPKKIVSGSKILHLLTQTSETAPPGSNFRYNSSEEIDTLGKILTKATGMPSKEFAKKFLCDKLGISNYSWFKAFKTQDDIPVGWGLKIAPSDAARLGQLILQKGNWKGKQIISEEYITNLMQPTFVETNSGYGYLVWLNNALGQWHRPFKSGIGKMILNAPKDLIYASGFFGRFIIIIPSLDMVIVTFGKKFVWESLETIQEIYDAIEPALPQN